MCLVPNLLDACLPFLAFCTLLNFNLCLHHKALLPSSCCTMVRCLHSFLACPMSNQPWMNLQALGTHVSVNSVSQNRTSSVKKGLWDGRKHTTSSNFALQFCKLIAVVFAHMQGHPPGQKMLWTYILLSHSVWGLSHS